MITESLCDCSTSEVDHEDLKQVLYQVMLLQSVGQVPVANRWMKSSSDVISTYATAMVYSIGNKKFRLFNVEE